MKKITKSRRNLFPYFVLCLLLVGVSGNAFAQMGQTFGISLKYDFLPYQPFADPEKGTFEEDVELQEHTFSVQLSFPLTFAEGKTLLLNHLNYQRTAFDFRNWDDVQGGEQIDQVQSISYTAFLLQQLSEKWQLAAAVTPGLASDFEGVESFSDLSSDDVTFTAILGVIRKFNENFSLGAGVAYERDFGDPLPLPFIYFDWNIRPNLHATGILPQNLAISYTLHPMIDLGLLYQIDGNRYHGDPDKYGVDNPQMAYTIGTIGPTAQIHLTKWFHLYVEGGYTFLRNFEFRDGDDEKRSLDTDQTVYLRTGILFGM